LRVLADGDDGPEVLLEGGAFIRLHAGIVGWRDDANVVIEERG